MEKWLNVDWSEDLDIWFVFVGIFLMIYLRSAF